jgi:subtilisin family serine protease
VGFLLQVQPRPTQSPLSEGIATIGLPAWHAAGYTGQGVKIGILDQGFDGYRDLLGTRLPLSVTAQSFVPGVAVDGTGLTHGVAVAEIIHAAAPDAQLFLAHYDGGDVSMGNAVEWLMRQGVNIISHSAGGLAAPMDGTGRDAELADQVAAVGRLWINSAGNAANQHYRGTFTDSNGDLIHEFAPDKTTLGFQSDPAGLTQIILNWNDWGKGGTQDLDLFLLDADGNIIASARNTRDGDRPPVEQILFQFDDSRTYFLTINCVKVTQPLRLDLYIHQTSNLEMADPNGSLATPGDARGALTVGAAYWRTDELEPFSSRGPTTDGRIKPDLVGPDGVLSDIFAPDRFFGTSAAAPHIAGAAAVVWSAYPSATADEIKLYLTTNTIDLMEPGVDAATGAGRLLLPAPPAAPTITSTPVNTPVSTGTPAPNDTPTSTFAPDQPSPTAPPSVIKTPTPPRIVIVTPIGSRPRPPVQSSAPDGSWIGLIAIGLAAILTGVAGWRFTRRPDRAAPRSARSIATTPLACSHCGRTLPADAVFCAQCGRPVGATQTMTRCAHCGRTLRPGAKHCARCGQAA